MDRKRKIEIVSELLSTPEGLEKLKDEVRRALEAAPHLLVDIAEFRRDSPSSPLSDVQLIPLLREDS